MKTYQDLMNAGGSLPRFIWEVITEHTSSPMCRIAAAADTYDHQMNEGIHSFVRTLYSKDGQEIPDRTFKQLAIASNFFHRLNTQRNMYSLGNGVTFPDDKTKESLGKGFDAQIQDAGYNALIHGVSFLFWNLDRVHIFPLTQFAPLWDEETGALGAGVRFWQLAPDKPLFAVLYEVDGYSKYRAETKGDDLKIVEPKRPYKTKVLKVPALGDEIIGGDNYSALPIVPLWGSKLHQSTLVGMKSAIDSYDLVKSGFAYNVSECATNYWIIENAGAMEDKDYNEFRKNLMFRRIANVDADSGVKLTPYSQEIPHEASQACLDGLRQGIYNDFGGLDVSNISASAKTATEIDAAYQPLDENADDYEYQIITCVEQLLHLQGKEGEDVTPQFKRNRITNQLEQVQMVVMEAPYLDDETVLNKLPNVTPDEVKSITEKKDAEDMDRIGAVPAAPAQTEPIEEGAA